MSKREKVCDTVIAGVAITAMIALFPVSLVGLALLSFEGAESLYYWPDPPPPRRREGKRWKHQPHTNRRAWERARDKRRGRRRWLPWH